MDLSFLFTYLLIAVAVFCSIWIGFLIGKYIHFQRKKKNQNSISLGSITGAMLAFLGFILALTFSMVSSRYAARKSLVLTEANALGTAILRTDFLEEPLRSESRDLLREYVDIRAQFTPENSGRLPRFIIDSETIHDKLWAQVNQASNQAKETELFALYVQSLNEVIDIHSERYNQGLQYRLPQAVWFLLYFVTTLAMVTVGYEFGMNNSPNLLGSLLLSLMFSTIVFIISDLDQPGNKSIINISQKPMLDLQKKLKSSN